MSKPFLFVVLILSLFLPVSSTVQAQTDSESSVQAVLFYSNTCGHCEYVINEVLIPMINIYGDRLQIMGVAVADEEGQRLYLSAVEHFQIPDEQVVVPILIVGETVLIGSGEIPDKFPAIVEEGLAAGGIGWPDFPGMAELIETVPPEAEPSAQEKPSAQEMPTATSEATAAAEAATEPTAVPVEASVEVQEDEAESVSSVTPQEKPPIVALDADQGRLPFSEIDEPPPDPVGFTIAGVVLAGMAIALAYSGRRLVGFQRKRPVEGRLVLANDRKWIVLLLILIGLGVASYMAYVEIRQIEAACGPVGNCNIVQSSTYAQILGVPVAVLGILSFLAIGSLWFFQKPLVSRLENLPVWGLVGLTVLSTLFSIYLTLLELFVIHAVCAWCLTSAVTATALMLLTIVSLTSRPD